MPMFPVNRMAGRAMPGAVRRRVGVRRGIRNPIPYGPTQHAAVMAGRSNVAAARRGKGAARYVAAGVGGAMLVGGLRNNSGRPADRIQGRPTGPYMY